MSLYEQEVTISFTEADKEAQLYSASPRWIRKMDALCEKQPEVFRCTEEVKDKGEVVGKFYMFPKKLITIRPKPREMTPEEKRIAGERLRENLAKAGQKTE